MEELFTLCVVIIVIGGVVAMVIDYRIDAVEEPRRRGTGWIRAALVFVRVLQGLIVLGVSAFILSSWLSSDSVDFDFGGGSVSAAASGDVVVRGEPGYMVGICTGEKGPRGGWTAAELCPRDRAVREAFGRGASPDHAIIRKTVREPGFEVWALFALGTMGLVAYIALLSSLAQMLKRAAAGRPFDPRGVRSLRVMAAALVVGGSIVPGLLAVAIRALVDAQLGAGSVPVGAISTPLWPCGMALMLLALAEIWRFGARLQEDAEATV